MAMAGGNMVGLCLAVMGGVGLAAAGAAAGAATSLF
jgi:hypothetical protein